MPYRTGQHIQGRIVVFDDEASMGRILVKTLGLEGFEAKAFTNPIEGLEALEKLQPDVLLTDMRMPEMDGMAVLDRMNKEFPDVPVLIVTAFGTVEGAVDAMQTGAFNYITKPFQQGNLLAQITRAMQHRRMLQENVRLSEQTTVFERGSGEIVGQSDAIQGVREIISRAAPTDSSVLITGNSGVGKELVARAVHNQSRRGQGRFIAINCPSIPPSLIESEMFGYERGAFTGADRSKMGLMELAEGGTLLLDEVAELPIEMQVKLLRVLQELEFERVGGSATVKVDVRVLASTNSDLDEVVALGLFRQDLLYRLKVVPVHLPPLRERAEDIPLLVEAFLKRCSEPDGRMAREVTPAAMQLLMQYSWPGNIREVQNVIENMVISSSGPVLDVDDMPPDIRSAVPTDGGSTFPVGITMRELEERAIRETLASVGGNRRAAAKILGIGLRTLHRKIQDYGLERLRKPKDG